MSKEDKTADGKADDGQEEFVMVEVDDEGKTLNQQPDDEGNEEDEDLDEESEGPDDEGEQRLGHAEGDQDDETPEERKERRKREQRAKRVRNRVSAEAKDRLIQNQGRMLL